MNCSSYKKRKALNVSKGVGEEHPMLKWNEHAGGGALIDPKYTASRRERERAAERVEQSGKPSGRRRPDDSRSCGIYGVARQSVPDANGSNPREVRFEDKAGRGSRGGTPHLSAITTTASCDCDDIDVDLTYRMCCLTVGDSPSYKAATLFDTGVHASLVNWEVAAWVEGQARRNARGKTSVDLTFFNEVSRLHETIRNIQAQVIDSCIPVIVSRPIIRANHLVRKIPFYFDEGPSSKPDQSQPVVPVTTLSTTRARWHRASVTPCARCRC